MRSGSRYVVSDPHGHLVELVAALQAQGLVDGRGDWAGGRATLWMMGDFFDRGPDGVGVVELVMRLQRQAAEHGGRVAAMLGNHEVLALGMQRFGEIRSDMVSADARQVQLMWLRNGGVVDDLRRLNDEHLAWLQALPATGLDGDWLVVHSDTLGYLAYGDTIEQVNGAITAALGGDLAQWWECWNRLTHRYDFAHDNGAAAVRQLTGRLGGTRVVHGHSIIAYLVDKAPHEVTAPYLYAEGTALAVDGGLYAGGPLLVVDLDR